MTAVSDLQVAWLAKHRAMKGIGEPVVEVPRKVLFVTDQKVYMTMTGLIALVENTLETAPKE